MATIANKALIWAASQKSKSMPESVKSPKIVVECHSWAQAQNASPNLSNPSTREVIWNPVKLAQTHEGKKAKNCELKIITAQLSKRKLIDMLDILSSLVSLYFEVFLLELIYIQSFYILSLYAASHNPS